MEQEKIETIEEKSEEFSRLNEAAENEAPGSVEQNEILHRAEAVENELDLLEEVVGINKDEVVSFYENLSPVEAEQVMIHDIGEEYPEIQTEVSRKDWQGIKNWIIDKGSKIMPRNKLSRVLACALLLSLGSTSAYAEMNTQDVKEENPISLSDKKNNQEEIAKIEFSEKEIDLIKKAEEAFSEFFKGGIKMKDKIDMGSESVIIIKNNNGESLSIIPDNRGGYVVQTNNAVDQYIVDENNHVKFKPYFGEVNDQEAADKYLDEVASQCQSLEDVYQFLNNYMEYNYDDKADAIKGEFNQKKRSAKEIIANEDDGRFLGVCLDYSIVAQELISRSPILNKKYSAEVFSIDTFATEEYNVRHAYAVAWEKGKGSESVIWAIDNHGVFDISNNQNGQTIKKYLDGDKVNKSESSISSVLLATDVEVSAEDYFSRDRNELIKESRLIKASYHEDDPNKKIEMLKEIVENNPGNNAAVSQMVNAYDELEKYDESLELLIKNMESGNANKRNLRKVELYSQSRGMDFKEQIARRIKELYP